MPQPSDPDHPMAPNESGSMPDWLREAQEAAAPGGGAIALGAGDPGPGDQGKPVDVPDTIALPWRNKAHCGLTTAGRPWLSLAAIVGNEAHHIERFLQAFEPLVDEIVLVRAIGRAKPDATMEIAARVATKPLCLGEYKNDPNLDWEHVDSFCQARNAAFALARGEFIMWADCDDIIDPDNLKRLRAAVDLGNFDALLCHYRVIGTHPLIRERVMKRGIGRWVNACHEAVSLPDRCAKILRIDIEVFHFPLGDGKGNSKAPAGLERNLRVLEHSIGPSALAYFYLHRDSLLKNDVEKALEWGKLAISSPNLSSAERYRVFFNIAMIFLSRSDWGQMETFAMNGIRHSPERRECFCILAVSHIERKDYAKALIWIQLAMCINPPDPRQPPNWWESSWYGWRGAATHAFILRKLKLPKEADEAESFEHEGHPMISLLHATRGRASAATQARELWLTMASQPGKIEHIFAVDADDKASCANFDGFRTVVVEPGGGCVRAWNEAAKVARGRILVQMSDDWIPPYHWDNLIVWRMQVALEAKKPAVLAISDGHRTDRLICMAILTREYYKRQRHEKTGEPYLFHPDYQGVYSDNEFTVRAYENGAVIEAKDLVFEHQHPVFTGAPMDATYSAQNSAERYATGLATFNRRNPRYKIDPTPAPAATEAEKLALALKE